MTTIAYNHKDQQIACDGRCCAGSTIMSDTDMKWVYDKADLWFFCGSTSDQQKFIDCHRSGDALKEGERIDAGALLVRDGKVYACGITEEGAPFQCPSRFNRGIGSGEEWAMAAMDFGKSAADAVAYAMTRDCNTGGKISVYDIATARFL